jgi:hypothetical protein
LIKKGATCPCLSFPSLESEDPSQYKVEECQTKNFAEGSFGQSLPLFEDGRVILPGDIVRIMRGVQAGRYWTMAYNGIQWHTMATVIEHDNSPTFAGPAGALG